MTYYKQCILKRGDEVMTAWIPETLAKQRKILEIEMDGEWINGWLVFIGFICASL